MTEPPRPASPPAGNASPPVQPPHASTTDRAVAALRVPLAVSQRVLPASPLPVALGTGALLVAGLVEWPAAAALGLGYLALRSWRTARP